MKIVGVIVVTPHGQFEVISLERANKLSEKKQCLATTIVQLLGTTSPERRLATYLAKGGLNCVGDLLNISRAELERKQGVGPRGIQKLETALEKFGLFLPREKL